MLSLNEWWYDMIWLWYDDHIMIIWWSYNDHMMIIQGGFFYCSSPISVPERKSPISQSQPFLLTKFNETAAVIGWLAIFFLVLKLGRNSQKNHPVYYLTNTNCVLYFMLLTRWELPRLADLQPCDSPCQVVCCKNINSSQLVLF